MNKRKNTFDEHRKGIQEKRLQHLRKALKILGKGNYESITQLAHAASQLVTEFEKRSSKDGENIEPVSYTTLLRNKDYYRPALEAYFYVDDDENGKTSPISKEDYEALAIHCANLDHQNTMLKDRLASIDLSSKTKSLLDPTNNGAEAKSNPDRLEDIAFLLHMIREIIKQVPDLFETVEENQTTDEYPESGYWGPDGLVLTLDEVKRLEALSKECKENDL